MYSPRYNITFMGLEKLHPFDAGKWGKVINFLKGKKAPSCPPPPLDLHLPPPAPYPYHSSDLHLPPPFLLPILILI